MEICSKSTEDDEHKEDGGKVAGLAANTGGVTVEFRRRRMVIGGVAESSVAAMAEVEI